ncbi:cell wall-binding repeat-containing protein [Dehalobacter restrictus]|uniref:cell wall-binding repeat-containing protein n=1 Tax=Dehalobacter restrictus TaxID=55583 RepID=UPI00338EFE03
MSRTKKIAVLAIIAMVLTLMPAAMFAATADSTRLSGAGRVETALDICSAGWSTASTVVLAPADQANLVDALAAAPLAGQENAPILLTFKGSLDAAVKAKIAALGASKVYVVGAISDAVAAEVDAMTGVTVEALKGNGRQATAAAINAKLTSPAGTFVVGYDAVPDALSVASYAAKNKYAIVLANQDGSVASSGLVGATKYIIGGAAKVDDISGVTRVFGADRFATNTAVASTLSFSYERIYVANGISCVDALAVAPLAAKYNSFVALSSSSDVAAASVVNAKLLSGTKVIAVGGASAVSEAVVGKIVYANTALVVQSVTPLNASQIKVTFSKEVDKYTAEDEANYLKNGVALASGTDLATLQDDKKSVIVTVNTAFVNDSSYSIKVQNVLDATNLSVKVPVYIGSFLMSDKTVPAITSATASAKASTTTVTVKFNEPIATVGGVLIGGQAASVKTAPGTIASGNSAKVVLTSAQSLTVGQSYTITFNSVADRATTANTASVFSPVTTTFTVESDAVGPQVTGITQSSDTKLEVAFNEDIDTATGVFVIDATGLASGTITGTGAAHATKKNVIVVTMAGLTYTPANNRTLYVDVKGVKDLAGNMMADSLDTVVTVTKDVTKPVYQSYTIDSATNQKILAFYNEDLTSAAPAMTNFVLVDKDGVDVSGTYLTGGSARVVKNDRVTAADGPYLEINLAAALPAGTYSLTIKAATVTDTALALNQNAAVTFSVTSGTISDTATFTATIAQAAGNNHFTVTYSKAVKGGAVAGSATDPNNYMLGATALPAGTTITLNAAKTIADITLAVGTVSGSKAETLTVAGVQSLGGGTVTTASATVAVTDNSKPTLVSAEAKSPTTIALTFSEPVTFPAFAAGDVVVSNGLDYVSQNATAVASVVGKVITMTVPNMSAINQDYLKVTINAGEIADIAGTTNDKVTDATVVDKFVTAFAITSLADLDGDVAINGADIQINYTALTDKDIKEYKLFLFTVDPVATKVSDLDSYVYSWTGASLPATTTAFPATVVLDSNGAPLAAAAYTAYIVTYDNNGNSSISASATVTLDAL